MSFWGDSLTKPPFKVTSAEVVIICPDVFGPPVSSKRPLVHSVQTLGNSDQDGSCFLRLMRPYPMTDPWGNCVFTYMCSLMFMVSEGIHNIHGNEQLVMMKIP